MKYNFWYKLIGATFTRLQTLYVKKYFSNYLQHNDPKSVLSYGSCQFPTLGFVVERYKENKEFVSEEFWKLTGKDEQTKIEFHWERNGLSVQLFDRMPVLALCESCNLVRRSAKVKEVVEHPKSKWRPFPLDTIQLERLGSKQLKLTAKRIMEAAEKLYQRGYISYPR